MLEDKLHQNHISRINFIRKSALLLISLPSLAEIVLASSLEVRFSDAKSKEDLRQQYLDLLFKRLSPSMPYIESLKYEKDAIATSIKNALKKIDSNENEIPVIEIDSERLSRAYAYTNSNISNFGKGKKSIVYVFPPFFEKPEESELEFILYHENVHCEEIFGGVRLNGETININKLSPKIITGILELSAMYKELEHIFDIGTKEGEAFLQRVKLSFIKDRETEYSNAYLKLKAFLEQDKLSEYEYSTSKKYLKNLDKWIIPEQRYREPT